MVGKEKERKEEEKRRRRRGQEKVRISMIFGMEV